MPKITLEFSTAHAKRIQATLEHVLGLDEPATVADLKAYIIQDVKQLVRSAEKAIVVQAMQAELSDVEIT